jgi:hypothetical protein
MVVLFGLLGALAIGLFVGLTWRGFVVFGDRRQFGILTEQLQAEHRMSVATNQAIARMREVAREHLGRNDSA